jgi:hypothetical protein
MEAFLENLKLILPAVGLDLLKPRVLLTDPESASRDKFGEQVRFEAHDNWSVPAHVLQKIETSMRKPFASPRDPRYFRPAHPGSPKTTPVIPRASAEILSNPAAPILFPPAAQGLVFASKRKYATAYFSVRKRT